MKTLIPRRSIKKEEDKLLLEIYDLTNNLEEMGKINANQALDLRIAANKLYDLVKYRK